MSTGKTDQAPKLLMISLKISCQFDQFLLPKKISQTESYKWPFPLRSKPVWLKVLTREKGSWSKTAFAPHWMNPESCDNFSKAKA